MIKFFCNFQCKQKVKDGACRTVKPVSEGKKLEMGEIREADSVAGLQ